MTSLYCRKTKNLLPNAITSKGKRKSNPEANEGCVKRVNLLVFDSNTSQLFVIGGIVTNSCEVYDSNTNKFTLLKQPSLASGFDLRFPFEVIAFGNNFFVFRQYSDVKIYDFENNEWSVKTCEATKNIKFFSVLKYM